MPIWLLLATAALGGCATPAPPPALPAAPGTAAGTPHWWTVHVDMGWHGADRIDWHLDALLAEQVFAPLVERLGPALVLWRFHRRAAPDASGHRLRFLFYADAAIAARVAGALRASALLAALLERGDVTGLGLPDTPGGEAVEAASDPAWPLAVQRAWPHFAMGVSRNWLALIAEVGAPLPPPARGDTGALIGHYREVNARVDALWQAHAQHAWLHHLNALFGYQPVLIREQRLMRF